MRYSRCGPEFGPMLTRTFRRNSRSLLGTDVWLKGALKWNTLERGNSPIEEYYGFSSKDHYNTMGLSWAVILGLFKANEMYRNSS
jgi:hypothetical protein